MLLSGQFSVKYLLCNVLQVQFWQSIHTGNEQCDFKLFLGVFPGDDCGVQCEQPKIHCGQLSVIVRVFASMGLGDR